MPKSQGLVPLVIILGVAVAAVITIGTLRLFSILPGNVSQKDAASFVKEFASVVSKAKPPAHSGLVAEPPWDEIKLVEKFANGKIAKDAKLDYRLNHNWGKGYQEYQESGTVSFYVSAKPFRWRADFAASKINYQAVLINNGGEYYSCFSENQNKNCNKVDSLENLNVPASLTDFLNTVLDVSRLNLFLTQTPEVTTRTIAGKAADCLKVEKDKDGTYPKNLEICTDKESKLPLFVGSKDNFQQFTLEATKVDISPQSPNLFSLPIPSPQPTDSRLIQAYGTDYMKLDFTAKIQADFEALRRALEVYLTDNKVYPSSLSLLVPNYLSSIPYNPYSFKPYKYEVTNNTYTLTTELPDGSTYTKKSP